MKPFLQEDLSLTICAFNSKLYNILYIVSAMHTCYFSHNLLCYRIVFPLYGQLRISFETELTSTFALGPLICSQ